MPNHTYNLWSPAMIDTVRELYPTASWEAILAALPGVTRTAIYQRAIKMGLSRWNQGDFHVVGAMLAGSATDAEIGWIAGALDGEGTIGLARALRTDGKRSYYSPFLQVVNTDEAFTAKAHRLLGGTRRINGKERYPIHVVYVKSMTQVGRLLEMLLPHLTVKARRAGLLLQYVKIRHGKPGKSSYGNEEASIWEQVYEGSKRVKRDYANAVLIPATADKESENV